MARRRSLVNRGEVALVFGNERTGLTDGELALCSLASHIPSSSAFPSLNLAHAVQVVCYELRRQVLAGRDGSADPVKRAEVVESVARIAGHLREMGFFKVTRDRGLSAFLRDTAERAAYTASELRYFESIFRKAAGMHRGSLKDHVLGQDFRGAAGQDQGSMHDIAKLPDVPGPIVVDELFHRLDSDPDPPARGE